MGKVKNYTDLLVWQKSIELVKEVYIITKSFPKEEIYGLTSQMRRAAVSIPSNIAEGFLRQHKPEIIQFLYISLSSCGELHTQFLIAKELKFVSDEQLNHLFTNHLFFIVRMLQNLIKSLKNK
ncbi:MAG: four helix bundle protein [Elusimicrobiota bacterium]